MVDSVAKAEVLKAFGTRVRHWRRERGFSQEYLADLSGLHRTYIGGLERGERNASIANVIRIATALEVDPGELIRGMTYV